MPPRPGPRLLAQAARVVAYPAVRARGTIGGSVALADPAADYPVALVRGRRDDRGRHRPRAVAASRAREFFRGLFETALAQGEIVTADPRPAGPAGRRRGVREAVARRRRFRDRLGGGDRRATLRRSRSAAAARRRCSRPASRLTDEALLAAGRALARRRAIRRATTAPRAAYRRRVLPELCGARSRRARPARAPRTERVHEQSHSVLHVNGETHDVLAPVPATLLEVLRDAARPHRLQARLQPRRLRRLHRAASTASSPAPA